MPSKTTSGMRITSAYSPAIVADDADDAVVVGCHDDASDADARGDKHHTEHAEVGLAAVGPDDDPGRSLVLIFTASESGCQ